MASKTFITMSKKDCLTFYKDVLQASESNWKSGIILARENQFGNAMSMAIISAEELVKAIIILFDGNGFEFRRVQGMDALFANHQIRYVIQYAMMVINIFMEDLKTYFIKFREDPSNGMDFLGGINANDINFVSQVEKYGLETMARLALEFEWFSKVDVYRQQGFYSDYEGQLQTPIKIDAETYQQAFARLEKVRAVGLELITSLESSEELYVNHFNSMRRNMKQKKTYALIGNSLAVLRQTRENPFAVIKKYFESKHGTSSPE
jgi:AbiV family abortive infection protein